MKTSFHNPFYWNSNVIVILLFLLPAISSAQQEFFYISSGLRIQTITDHVSMHTYSNSNGMVFIDQNQAIIVSTPPSDEETRNLISWVRDSLKKDIVAYVIDRWHPDAMEGLDIIQRMSIPNYSSNLTRSVAKEKGLPVPDTGFDEQLDLTIGGKKVSCHYFGPAHTVDGIVVYIPSEEVLFGGNEIRNYNGWVGNIADAHLDQWSETVQKIKNSYGGTKHVIPGHGPAGGSELIDYTLQLYEATGPDLPEVQQPSDLNEKLKEKKVLVESSESDTLLNGIRIVANAVIYINKGEQYIRLESPGIELEGNQIRSDEGRITIGNHMHATDLPETDGYYRRLIINCNEPVVGMTVILRELTR